MLCSNLGQDIDHPGQRYSCVFSFSPGKCQDITLIRPWSGAVLLLTVSLNNPQKRSPHPPCLQTFDQLSVVVLPVFSIFICLQCDQYHWSWVLIDCWRLYRSVKSVFNIKLKSLFSLGKHIVKIVWYDGRLNSIYKLFPLILWIRHKMDVWCVRYFNCVLVEVQYGCFCVSYIIINSFG